jgi:hypothetical protein
MINGRLSINGQPEARAPLAKLPDPSDGKTPVEAYVERLPERVSYRIIESGGDNSHCDNTPEFIVPASSRRVMASASCPSSLSSGP